MSLSNALSRVYLSLSFLIHTASATPAVLESWKSLGFGISLDAAGLVALADLSTINKRTALTGTAAFLDILPLAPGIHCQQAATDVNGGELPATAAMTTGYVFHIENPATVHFFQKVGVPNHLVQVKVEPDLACGKEATFVQHATGFFAYQPLAASLLYLLGPIMTVGALVLVVLIEDWWGLSVLCMLIFARLCNVLVIRRRAIIGWRGVPEPGVEEDLLILCTRNKFIRIRSFVDDLKAVTVGGWLWDPTSFESFVVATSTLIVFVVAALVWNASQTGRLIVLCLLLMSVVSLGLSNHLINTLRMHGRILTVVGMPKKYTRGLDLIHELIDGTGRDDWAVALGMAAPTDRKKKEAVV